MAQKILAKEIITDLHGNEEYLHAKEVSESLFTGNIKNLTEEEIETVFKGIPTIEYENTHLLDFLVDHHIVSSKREGREFLVNHAITVNGENVIDENFILEDKKYNIIRRGKKKYYLVKKGK